MRRIRRRIAAAAASLAAALVTGGAASARPFATAFPSLVLSPSSASLFTGQSHTVTATLKSAAGSPMPDQTVRFTVTGANAGQSGSAVTNPNGQATFTYTGSSAGSDTITAAAPQFGVSTTAAATWSVDVKADVSVTVTPPYVARVGGRATFTAKVANAGPDTATGVILKATSPAGAALVSATTSVGGPCSGTTCPIGTLAPNASATVTLVYSPSQEGALTLGATVSGDYDPNGANNAASATTTAIQPGAPPPPPPAPAQPGTFNAVPTGTILVNGAERPTDQLFQLNAGDTVDVTNGVVTFTAADGSYGSFSSSQPVARRSVASASRATANLPAQFVVAQAATGGVTTLTLTGADFSACGSSRALAAKRKTPIRQLWGSAKGSFQTKGRYAAATVRGTIWLVQDRCDGTLAQVVQGTVDVLDATRGRTVAVPAGGTYLAAPRSPLRAPAQTAAQVARRGLLYSGRTYRTKRAFSAYLTGAGWTWRDFARRYPRLAAALAKRR